MSSYRWIFLEKEMDKLFANSGDPDQMQHSAASIFCLHCLPNTILGVSGLQWVKELFDLDLQFAQACLFKYFGLRSVYSSI